MLVRLVRQPLRLTCLLKRICERNDELWKMKRRSSRLQEVAQVEKKRKEEEAKEPKEKVTKSPGKKAPHAEAIKGTQALPKRNKKNELMFKDHPEFRPNLTPKEVLQMGSFGGTYFRPIHSGVKGERLSGVWKEFPKDWFEGLDKKTQVVSSTYRPVVNKYGVKCGGSLDMWESSGWISDLDPYGWFHWYCRFYLGRRSTDDERQISRALGVMGQKGRFRNQLIGKLSRNSRPFNDHDISPVIRQTLQHWGYQLTETDAQQYLKKKKMSALPKP